MSAWFTAGPVLGTSPVAPGTYVRYPTFRRLWPKLAGSARHLVLFDATYAICRLSPAAELPGWGLSSSLWSVTRTSDEISVLCEASLVPSGVQAERDWRVFQVQGPLDLALVGLLASLTGALADVRVAVFALSTYDTDYLLVREGQVLLAIGAWRSAGHTVTVR